MRPIFCLVKIHFLEIFKGRVGKSFERLAISGMLDMIAELQS